MTIEDVLAMADDEAIASATLLEAEFKHGLGTWAWAVKHPDWRRWDSHFISKGTAARAYLIARLNLEK